MGTVFVKLKLPCLDEAVEVLHDVKDLDSRPSLAYWRLKAW